MTLGRAARAASAHPANEAVTAGFAHAMSESFAYPPTAGRLHVAAWERGQPGDAFLLHADDVLPSASTIKVPIFAAILSAAERGRIDVEVAVPIPPQGVGGAGVLRSLRHVRTLTIADLLTLMMIVSDNVATNVLIDLIGTEEINRFCRELGLESTRVRRRMMDAEAARRGLDNTTTAREQCVLLDALAAGSFLTGHLHEFAGNVLAEQQFEEGLRSWLPQDIAVGHKTGTLPGVRHDVGIITARDGRRVVVAALVTGILQSGGDVPSGSSPNPLDALSGIAAAGLAAWLALERNGRA